MRFVGEGGFGHRLTVDTSRMLHFLFADLGSALHAFRKLIFFWGKPLHNKSGHLHSFTSTTSEKRTKRPCELRVLQIPAGSLKQIHQGPARADLMGTCFVFAFLVAKAVRCSRH